MSLVGGGCHGKGESSDDDDDMVGPSLGDGRSAVPDHMYDNPPTHRQAGRPGPRAEGRCCCPLVPPSSAYHHLESKARAKGGREEWMTMGPGVPSLANLQPSMKGRQFNQ